jgi:hypothetical protein
MAKKTSESRKAKYKSQPMRTAANRVRKVAKHAKRNPNDKQAEQKLATL